MKKYFKFVIMAILSAFAFFFDYSVFENYNYKSFINFYHVKTFELGILAIFLFIFYKKSDNKQNSDIRKCLAVLLTAFMAIGNIYYSSLSLEIVFSSLIYTVVFILKTLGYYFIIREAIKYIEYLDITKIKSIQFRNKYIKWYLEHISKYPFMTSFITIMCVLTIYFIAFYPIVLSPDPSFQIVQYFNIPTEYVDWVVQLKSNVNMTNHHPIFQTFLIGGCIEIGKLIGNDNFGLFVYTFIQSISVAAVLAYTIKVMIKNKISNKLSLIVLLGYIIIPMYMFYSICAVKDTYYTLLLMLLCLFLFDYIKNYKEKDIEINKIIYFIFIMFGLCIFRNNGIYILFLTIPFVIFFNKKNLIKLLCSFLIVFGSLQCYNKVFIPSLGVSNGSIREALSIPFQQIARYVKYHAGDLAIEEVRAVDQVLGYSNLFNYDPNLSDPVKNNFNGNYTKDELIGFFKVWINGFYRHPITYFDATFNNTYGFIYPSIHNWYLYYKYNKLVVDYGVLDFHFNKLLFLRGILANYGNLFPYIPVIGLLSSIGFSAWIIFIETALIIEKKKTKYLICLLPLYASLLICILGPANTYFRYSIPYMFMIPSLFILINEEEK